MTSGTTGGTGVSSGSTLTYQFDLSEPSDPPGGFSVADVVTTHGVTAYVTTAAITATLTGSGTPCTDTLVNTGQACDGSITVGSTNIVNFAVGDIITLGQQASPCNQNGDSFTIRAIGASAGIIYIHEKIAAEASGKCNVIVETCSKKVFSGSDKVYMAQCNGYAGGAPDVISSQVASSSFQDDARNSAAASSPTSLVITSDITPPTVTILALGADVAIATNIVDGNAGAAFIIVTEANRKLFRVGDEIVLDSSGADSNCVLGANAAVGSNAAVTPALRSTIFKITSIDTTNHKLFVDLEINVPASPSVDDCVIRRVLPSGTPYNGAVQFYFTLSEAAMEVGDNPNRFLVDDVKYGADGTAASSTCAASMTLGTTGLVRELKACTASSSGSDADVVVSIPAGAFTDRAGNPNLATAKHLVRQDATVPTSTVDAFPLEKYLAGTMASSDELSSGSSTASSQVVFRVTADIGITYTTGTSALPSVYGVCATTDSCGNAFRDATGTNLDTSNLVVQACTNPKIDGTKGVYYVHCDYSDGQQPSVSVPAGAFTDAARNENSQVSAVTVTFT